MDKLPEILIPILLMIVFLTFHVLLSMNIKEILKFKNKYKELNYFLGHISWFKIVYKNKRDLNYYDSDLQEVILKGRKIANSMVMTIVILFTITLISSFFNE